MAAAWVPLDRRIEVWVESEEDTNGSIPVNLRCPGGILVTGLRLPLVELMDFWAALQDIAGSVDREHTLVLPHAGVYVRRDALLTRYRRGSPLAGPHALTDPELDLSFARGLHTTTTKGVDMPRLEAWFRAGRPLLWQSLVQTRLLQRFAGPSSSDAILDCWRREEANAPIWEAARHGRDTNDGATWVGKTTYGPT